MIDIMGASAAKSEPHNRTGMMKVLIAEDSPVTQDILKLLLTGKGHEAHIARDGAEALKCLRSEHFDLALLDYHMPGLTGFEVVNQFTDSAAGQPLPVFVAMTADPEAIHANPEQSEKFAKVFAKPFDFDDVLTFIESVQSREASAADAGIQAPSAASGSDQGSREVDEGPGENTVQTMPQAERAVPGGREAGCEVDAKEMPETPDGPVQPERAGSASVGKHEKRVLIAEDSPVTQDILQLLLSSKGYDVDIAHDGTEALKLLKERNYTLALMDYHMPGLTGGQVVTRSHKEITDRRLPVFAAMTADPAALLADEGLGSGFSKIFAKPFDFDEVLNYIEEYAAQSAEPPLRRNDATAVDSAAAKPPQRNPPDPQAEVELNRTRPGLPGGDDLPVRSLRWPEDIGPAGFSVSARQYMAAGNDYDAVVISEPAAASDLHHLWGLGDLSLLPIIDETGHLGAKADISVPSIPRGVVKRMTETALQEFAEARSSVNLEVRQSKVLAEKLAASMYVRKRKLVPEYDAKTPLGFSYNTSLEDDEVLSCISELTELGLVSRRFFDRFHVCKGCRSVRLNVREECFDCHSPHLAETTLIHHFKCAYQAPVEDFQQGSDLVCPKCSRELRHFGVDYDKPGTIINCIACGASASEAAVGFKCLDCGQHMDGELIDTKDVFEYTLTDKGIAFVEEGPIVIGGAQKNLKFGELALELVIALNKSARNFTETSRPFCLMTVGYPNRRAATADHGARLVEKSRAQLIENLHNYFGESALTHQGTDYDYLLLNRLPPESARANLDSYIEIAQSGLKIGLTPRMTVFGPTELFG